MVSLALSNVSPKGCRSTEKAKPKNPMLKREEMKVMVKHITNRKG